MSLFFGCARQRRPPTVRELVERIVADAESIVNGRLRSDGQHWAGKLHG
jgi:hypothetical protein